MTKKSESSTAALWARFRFSVVGSLLSSPPARRTQGRPPSPGRQDLDASGQRPRGPLLRRHHRTLVLQVAAEGRPAPGPPPRRAQGLRQGLAGRGADPATGRSSTTTIRTGATNCTSTTWPRRSRPILRWDRCDRIPRSGGTCRPTACSASRGRAPKGRPGEIRAAQRREQREIRSYEAEYVGSLWHLRFPPRLAEGAHARRPVAAAARPGHPRRPFATVLPSAVVPLGDRRGSRARALPGDPETRSAPCAA